MKGKLMTEADQASVEATVRQLEALRADLLARVWPAAAEAAGAPTPERVRELVRLHADIQAIDFALKQRPT